MVFCMTLDRSSIDGLHMTSPRSKLCKLRAAIPNLTVVLGLKAILCYQISSPLTVQEVWATEVDKCFIPYMGKQTLGAQLSPPEHV